MKKRLMDIAVQIIPVMIGVYLGFLVSDWGEARRLRRQMDLLLSNIEAEIQANQRRLEAVLPYHVQLRDSSGYYLQPDHELPGKPMFFHGTNIIPLVNSAFATGVQTGVLNELSLSLLQQLNQLYSLQESYNDYGDTILKSLLTMDFTESAQNRERILRLLQITMTDVVIQEEQLLEIYRQIELNARN